MEFGAFMADQEERADLLRKAADLLDERRRSSGPAASGGRLTRAISVRMFAEDRAELGRPELFRLAPGGLEAALDGVPVTFEE